MAGGKGVYRIHAVSERTGIPPPTLRAWERRYGIPAPARTGSAYRLYSERDVEMIVALRDLCAAGLSAREAATRVKQDLASAEVDREELDPYAHLVEAIVEAAAAVDPETLRTEARRALMLGSATRVFHRVIAPAMVEIGERWHAAALGVGAEHLATEVLVGLSRQLLELVQPSAPARRALLACLSHEDHALPLYGAAIELAERGFESILLGARTPPDAIAATNHALAPDLIGLSVTCAPDPATLKAVLPAYARAAGKTPWVIGGRAAPELSRRVEALGGLVAEGDPGRTWAKIERALATRARGRRAR